jgi:ribonuclease J
MMKSFKPKFNLPQRGGQTLKIVPLGGVGDVTKNMYAYEYGADIMIIDCGVSFPDDEMRGVDLVIPDINYLRDKKQNIKGIVITHGHDDHYGALPYIWPELNVPIYSQKLTCGLIRAKLADNRVPTNMVKELKIDDKLELGIFKLSFYRVSHSVPDSTGIVIETPVGTIIHQSDFKIDWSPANGQITDVSRVAEVGSKGVLLMTIDCLNAGKPGYTPTEKNIEPEFEKIAEATTGKLIFTLITSNIARIQMALNVAVKMNRKVCFVGRSMENNVQVARDLGYLNIPPGIVIAQEELKRFAPQKTMIIMSGAFGQPGSALSRAANGEHKFVQIQKSDTVIVSADPMPSAEMSQGVLIDNLARIGCRVYYSSADSSLHVSGHAAAEEIKLMINLAKPKFLMPIGGGFKQIRSFGLLAADLGYKEDRVISLTEVQPIELSSDRFKILPPIPYQNVYVDGLGVGDVGSIVLRDREHMSEEGIVVVVVAIDSKNGKLSSDPDLISRGFVFGDEANDLLDAAKEIVSSLFVDHRGGHLDMRYARNEIENHLQRFFYEETKRRPLILTVVVEA